MKKIFGSIALLALVVMGFSCASDIVLEPPPSLKGVYKGEYIITILGEQPVEVKQTIRWIFEDKSYNMYIDTLNPNMTDLCICKVYGNYVVEDKVRLKQAQPGQPHAGCNTCRDDYSPVGGFDIDRSTDTLKLTYQDTQLGLLKEIKLLRVTDE